MGNIVPSFKTSLQKASVHGRECLLDGRLHGHIDDDLIEKTRLLVRLLSSGKQARVDDLDSDIARTSLLDVGSFRLTNGFVCRCNAKMTSRFSQLHT